MFLNPMPAQILRSLRVVDGVCQMPTIKFVPLTYFDSTRNGITSSPILCLSLCFFLCFLFAFKRDPSFISPVSFSSLVETSKLNNKLRSKDISLEKEHLIYLILKKKIVVVESLEQFHTILDKVGNAFGSITLAKYRLLFYMITSQLLAQCAMNNIHSLF